MVLSAIELGSRYNPFAFR